MNNINPNTQTAEIKGPQAAQPSFQMPIDDLQRAYDELSKMSAPRAAEIKGPQAAQPDYLREYKPRRR